MKERVARFMDEGDDFGALALDLYAWQRARCAHYDAFCGGVQVERWQEIPAVPVALFRELDLRSFTGEPGAVFRTSGTTTGRRGVHRVLDTELYDRGARAHAEAVLGPLPRTGISLVSHDPDSSLGHMCRRFVPDMPGFFSMDLGLDVAGAWAALRAAVQPVFVPGTAFAFAELVAAAAGPCPLPTGSVVMVTGGFKGRTVSLSQVQLALRLGELLPGARLVGEYGMTELSSQLWSDPLGGPFAPPPWMRVVAVEPWSGEPTERGLLRFYDLCNWSSVLAIETQDVGTVHPDGSVSLEGRLPGAEPRGCSLTVEEAQAAGRKA